MADFVDPTSSAWLKLARLIAATVATRAAAVHEELQPPDRRTLA